MKTARRSIVQRGFTLIELIITIVIIGILAAVAIPKFQNMSSEASTSVAQGAAAAIASATSVNYARRAAGSPGAVALANCGDIQTNIAVLADVPAGTTVTGGALATDGSSAACTVTVGTGTATAQMYGSV